RLRNICSEGLCTLFGTVPVSLRHAGAGDPYLANAIRGAEGVRFRIHNANLLLCYQSLSAAYQGFGVVVAHVWCGRLLVLQGCLLHGVDDWGSCLPAA